MRLLRGLGVLLCCALFLLALAGCRSTDSTGGAGGKRIIILTNGNSPFWDAAAVGVREAEKKFDLQKAGLTAVVETNDGTDGGQIKKLRQYGTQSDIVAIGLSVNTASNVAIVEEMKKLQEKGIHVVTI